MSPRERIDLECLQRGKGTVVDGCMTLLRGGDVDPALLSALGGPGARLFGEGEAPREDTYWLRVWALRGLLWAWDDVAFPAVRTALDDEAWRVREMALKVIARHRLDDALLPVVDRLEDPAARVRAAASRALMRLSS